MLDLTVIGRLKYLTLRQLKDFKHSVVANMFMHELANPSASVNNFSNKVVLCYSLQHLV